jgi:thioredoxin-like negative regulator of GroEL
MPAPYDTPALNELLRTNPAVFILFGGAHCGVCQVIKPKIEILLSDNFPEIAFTYIDCEQQPDICGQSGVFSLPTVKFYLEGQLSLEMSRVFSLKALAMEIERIYRRWAD